jgi:colicin import membrane protein
MPLHHLNFPEVFKMALNPDVKKRIFDAADELHAASETGDYPNVEAVRQRSRAGMNNVVEAMQEWRQKQRKQVQAVREPLPAHLNGVLQSMGQNLWETAQQLANESLDTARAAFESEKADLLQLSVEQSDAYEKQAVELEAAHLRMMELERLVEAAETTAQTTAQRLEDVQRTLLSSEQKAAIAEQKAEEIERRAADLRAELDHAHTEADRLRTERDKAQERSEEAVKQAEKADARTEQLREVLAAQTEKADATIEQLRESLAAQLAKSDATIEQLRTELTETRTQADAADQLHTEQRKRTAEEVHRCADRMTKAETACDQARAAAAEAREEAATLRGQLEATKTQNAAMLAALKPSPTAK